MHSHDRTLIASLGFADPDKKNSKHTLACKYLSQPEVATKVWARIVPAPLLAPKVAPSEAQIDAACAEEAGMKFRGQPYNEDSAERAYGPIAGIVGLSAGRGEMEVPIIKADRSKFLIGFWDVVSPARVFSCTAHVTRRSVLTGERTVEHGGISGLSKAWQQTVKTYAWGEPVRGAQWHEMLGRVRIEVKATRVDVADIARQLALYEQHTDVPPMMDRGEGRPFRFGGIVVATTWQLPPDDKAVLERKGYHTIWLGGPFDEWCRNLEHQAPDASEEAL